MQDYIAKTVGETVRQRLGSFFLWLLLAHAVTIGLTAFVVSMLTQRHMERYTLSAVVMAEQERVQAIADILHEIPRTPGHRLEEGPRRGAPTVVALQAYFKQAGKHMPAITMRERDLACERVVGACQP